jgi:hypothetical protein
MMFPALSRAFSISNIAITLATNSHTFDSANHFPGHALMRMSKPQLAKRQAEGLDYSPTAKPENGVDLYCSLFVHSTQVPLGYEFVWIRKHRFVSHHGPDI